MGNRELAEKIYNHLNEKGAGLGNASVMLIESVLNKVLPQANVIKSVCENCNQPVNTTIEYRCDNCHKSVISEQTVL